jgi:hypothetical protein
MDEDRGRERRINGGEDMGEIKAILRSMNERLIDISMWQYKHDGQGEGTTHHGITKRLESVEKGQVRTNTIFAILQAGMAAVLTLLGLKEH